MIDYRKILIAYIEVIGHAEGTDFLGDEPEEYLDGMTKEEAIELAKIRDAGRSPEHVKRARSLWESLNNKPWPVDRA